MSSVLICACGHPVSRHELVGTEYARCQRHPWHCYCSGGEQVALVVEELMENPSGSQTVAKYFRRTAHVGSSLSEHPFNAGVEKIRAEGIGYRFVGECWLCGVDGEYLDMTVVPVDSNGELKATVKGLVSRHAVVCDVCLGDVG